MGVAGGAVAVAVAVPVAVARGATASTTNATATRTTIMPALPLHADPPFSRTHRLLTHAHLSYRHPLPMHLPDAWDMASGVNLPR